MHAKFTYTYIPLVHNFLSPSDTMRRRYVDISSVLLCFFLIDYVSSQLSPAQNSTMSRLYGLVTSNTSSNPNEWTYVEFAQNPCSWSGVSCSIDNTSVIRLKFAKGVKL